MNSEEERLKDAVEEFRQNNPSLYDECMMMAEIPEDELWAIRDYLIEQNGEAPNEEIFAEWEKRKSRRKLLPKLDSVTESALKKGHQLGLSEEWMLDIAECDFRGDNLELALVACDILYDERPITLRGLMYRLVSAGFLPSTDKKCYNAIGRVMTRLRQTRCVPFNWLVDGVRSTNKPSSWSGITEFVDTVKDCYRMDFWAQLDHYVHVIVEKDAMAGVISPVTREYDVALSPIRGYVSLSFAWEIASTWNSIEKPIFCYYLGDFDASGFDLERDIENKLREYTKDSHPNFYSDRSELGNNVDDDSLDASCIRWKRIGVNPSDFEEFSLLPLPVKKTDKRAAGFIAEHGHQCAELDAIPSSEIRRRVRDAIESHIPQEEWLRLKKVEEMERNTFVQTLANFSGGGA